MPQTLNRRSFIAGLSSIAAGFAASPAAAEPPPEVTRVRLPLFRNHVCISPLYVAGELLRAEGFTEIKFVETGTGPDSADWLGRSEIDFDWNFPPANALAIANGLPAKVLAGMHGGCLELFANDRVRGVKELKGKRVGVDYLSGSPHLFLILIAASVGIDPGKDIEWIAKPDVDPIEQFAAGDIDAVLLGPPYPQRMRARKLGRVILNFTYDRPWSQHFCCMLSARSDFIERNPVATKRVLRALLKAVDLCASEPERVVRSAVEGGYAADYDSALQTLRELRYDIWRDFDPEDSMRFYALRMLESGIITANPRDIIAQGTDWRFLNELKRELKS
jgi:NitT/TauT family transport system substrate-binding protein